MPRLTIGAPIGKNIGMPKHSPPDLSRLLREMHKAGLSQARIAAEAGTSQATISVLMRKPDTTTVYETGWRIVAMHKELMRRRPTPETAKG